MSKANLYPVKIDWIPGLPQIPYRGGVGMYEGVVMHDTCSPGDTAASERAYESRTYNAAFVHEFIDPTTIIQVADPTYIAYGAGRIANQRFVHLELCSADTAEEFEWAFDMWCQRAAVHLANRGLPVLPAQPDGTGTLWGHFEVSGFLGGSDHMDPIDTLAKWGKTWDDVVARVTQHYDVITKGDELEVELQQWQWDMLANALDGLNKKGIVTDANWTMKAQKKELTRDELTWLNTIMYARQNGIAV
jgi:N-acetylmuramoyl-L-alanine amidase CwlA